MGTRKDSNPLDFMGWAYLPGRGSAKTIIPIDGSRVLGFVASVS